MKIDNATGYLWYSDKLEPELFDNEVCEIPDEVTVPFIVEGMIYDGTISYAIMMVDGEYCIKETVVNDMSNFTEQTYIAHKMGAKELKMRMAWGIEKDALCEEFETLVPAEFVFVGFKKE